MFGQVTSINMPKQRGMIRGIDNGTGRELPFTPSDMADPMRFRSLPLREEGPVQRQWLTMPVTSA